MGILALIEDRPTPKAVYNWRVYTAAIVASWASCMVSLDHSQKPTLKGSSPLNDLKLNLRPLDRV